MHNLIRSIRRFAASDTAYISSDEQLLHRFFEGREQEAFAELVERHGPLVMGVCERMLRHPQDAEDAFQATFLTLVRKGRSIRQRGALSSWLYRVAFRIALRQRERTEKRNAAERLDDVAIEADPSTAIGRRELLPVLDREINLLPEKYRSPMILCYLEGKTYEEAAMQIGCPKGTVAIRLLRGRELLKRKLVRRGLMAGAALVGVATLPGGATAAVPATAVITTVSSACALACGAALSAVVPASVAALVEWTSREAWREKAQVLVMVLVGLGLAGSGASVGAQVRSDAPVTYSSDNPARPSDFSNYAPDPFARAPLAPREQPPLGPAPTRFVGQSMTLNMIPATNLPPRSGSGQSVEEQP